MAARLMSVLLLAGAVRAQGLDRDTAAGMDAEMRGDWVRAVEAFERALVDKKDRRGGARLRAARARGVAFLGRELDTLLKEKRLEDAARVAALGLIVKPGYHKFKGAAKRLAAKGVPVPAVAPEGEGVFGRRSPGGRLRCFTLQGADFARAEELVERCLDFLVAAQSEDGRWDADKYGGGKLFDTGVTGLAMLALLSRGKEGLAGPRGGAVAKAAAWLKTQHKEGVFGTRATHSFIYNTSLATKALAEYAVIAGETDEWRSILDEASRFIVDAQNPGKGWRYEPRGNENDTGATLRAVDALFGLRIAGVTVPSEAFAGAVAWVDDMTDQKYGQTGYNFKGGAPARPEGKQNRFPPEHSQAMTAAGVLVRVYGGRDPASLGLSLALLAEVPPQTRFPDRYYWELGARAYQAAYGYIPGAWYRALVEGVADGIGKDGAVSKDGVWSEDGGLVYSTAISALALASPYREPPPRRGAASAFLRAKRRTVAVAGRADEVPTGIYVDSGTVLDVFSRGVIAPAGDRGPRCGAEGMRKPPPGTKRVVGRSPFACLLGRIGPEGKLFRIKPGEEFTSKGTGQLYLLVNDAIRADNARGWEVSFTWVRQ